MTGVPVILIAALAAGGLIHLDAAALLSERDRTAASFRDPRQSPLAAVARHDFQGDRPMTLGSDPECDVQLEGVAARAATVRALADGFEMVRDGKSERLAPGAKLQLGRYTLRFSHQNFPGVVVLDPQSPRLATGPFPRWFPPDAAFRVEATLVHDEKPREEVVLSTRGNRRRALRLGSVEFQLMGRPLRLTAVRLLEPGVDESAVSIFFRDATTAHESYPVGRYVDAEPLGGNRYALDFNRAYNPTCAFSPLYNCPIPPRENVLAVPVRAGELDPGGH
ncbi:MAG TPA: DUF1684 domain-containing protein [Myxococcales bacterium]|jgi:uncharacterized protein (DUF1684 family)|nr:DUF1684 domain-containing protein [Myxococcales bacterium]